MIGDYQPNAGLFLGKNNLFLSLSESNLAYCRWSECAMPSMVNPSQIQALKESEELKQRWGG